MTKMALYAIVVSQSLTMVLASETSAQRKKLNEIFIEVQVSSQVQILLEDLVDHIESSTDFHFAYTKKVINDKVISIDSDSDKWNLHDLLSEISVQGRLSITRVNETITLIPVVDRKLPDVIETLTVQQTVIGTITDENGEVLPGATVVEKGTTNGTITDAKGKFQLNVNEDAVLLVSFVGYKPQEILVQGKSEIQLSLEPDLDQLEEVVVVAFGEQKKQSVLSSITNVNVEELRVPSSNLTTALAGRMAGVISYQRSGEPGEDNAQFFIRGVTTFGYKKDPLILIDGVELTTDDLARLNPDDIQSFSIMKDATATSLYGARGANGVILVTTKEGKEGKAKLSFRYEESVSSPTKEIELADPITYMQLHNAAIRTRNPLGEPAYTESQIGNTIKGTNPYVYPVNDWQELLFQDKARNRRFNMNVNGGGKVAQYYIAGSVKQDNGILKVDPRNNFNNNIKLNQYLLRSNITINLTNSTKMKVRMHGTFDDYIGPIDGGSTIFNKAMRTSPVVFPAYYKPSLDNQFTNHILFGNSSNSETFYANPYADLVKGYKDYTKTLLLTQLELEQDLSWITKGLKLNVLGNTSRYSLYEISRFYEPFYYRVKTYDRISDGYTLAPLNAESGTEYLGYNEGNKDITSNLYFQGSLNYTREIREKHNVSGMLVSIIRASKKANQGTLQRSLPSRNMGVSGRFTYSYDERYFTEFNFGYNGSERFSKGERYGFFPSVGLGWIVSNEPFWRGVRSVVDHLKVRATCGLVGNDAIGGSDERFFYLSEVSLNNGGYGHTFGLDNTNSSTGVSISRYENSKVTWEKALKANLGIELGFFDKLNFIIDIFREDRSNILMSRIIPASTGLRDGVKVRANVGEAYSQGIDISSDFNHFFNRSFWVTFRGNFTYASGRFKYYEEPDYSETPWLSRKDQSINQGWGLIAERLFVDDEEVRNSPTQTFGDYMAGDIKYRDINNDGKISDLDRVPIGHPTTPEIVYGFGVSVGYKNFDFNCFFQGSARSSFWIDVEKTAPFIHYNDDGNAWDDNVLTNNALLQAYADDHWSEENRDVYALWPRLSGRYQDNNAQRNTWFMQNGSFLRLKSVEVGYTLPQPVLTRIKTRNIRIYLSGTNLMSWSEFRLWDPEMAGNGLGYPVQRVFNAGVQVSF